jgi:cytochrome c peroxidase
MVRHHLDAIGSLATYDIAQALLPPRPDLDALDFVIMNDEVSVASIAAANELAPIQLSEPEFRDLIEFLRALTDPSSIDLRSDVPASLPSGNTLAE